MILTLLGKTVILYTNCYFLVGPPGYGKYKPSFRKLRLVGNTVTSFLKNKLLFNFNNRNTARH